MVSYRIVHPVTGDWAEADDPAAAEVAARTLRADALDAGTCTSPRVKCHTILEVVIDPEANQAAGGRREQGGQNGQQ